MSQEGAMAQTEADVLEKRIQQRLEQQTQVLIEGGAKDYPSYREVVGAITMLQYMLRDVREMKKQELADDDWDH